MAVVNANPFNSAQYSTTAEMTAAIQAALDAADVKGVIKFRGYISSTAPTAPETGDLWYQGTRPATPVFSGVKKWNGSAWQNETYTPEIFHLWSDLNDSGKGFYIFPLNTWNNLDFTLDVSAFILQIQQWVLNELGDYQSELTAEQTAAVNSGITAAILSALNNFKDRADGFATAAQGTKADNAATSAALSSHTSNNDIHVTAAQKTEWSAKGKGAKYHDSFASMSFLPDPNDGLIDLPSIGSMVQIPSDAQTLAEMISSSYGSSQPFYKINFGALAANVPAYSAAEAVSDFELHFRYDGNTDPDPFMTISNNGTTIAVKFNNREIITITPGGYNSPGGSDSMVPSYTWNDKTFSFQPNNLLKVTEVLIGCVNNTTGDKEQFDLVLSRMGDHITLPSFIGDTVIKTGVSEQEANVGIARVSDEPGNIIERKPDGLFAALPLAVYRVHLSCSLWTNVDIWFDWITHNNNITTLAQLQEDMQAAGAFTPACVIGTDPMSNQGCPVATAVAAYTATGTNPGPRFSFCGVSGSSAPGINSFNINTFTLLSLSKI